MDTTTTISTHGTVTKVPAHEFAEQSTISRGYLLASFLLDLDYFETKDFDNPNQKDSFFLPHILTTAGVYFKDDLLIMTVNPYLAPFPKVGEDYVYDCKQFDRDQLHMIPVGTLQGQPHLTATRYSALYNTVMLFAEFEYERYCLLGSAYFQAGKMGSNIKNIRTLALQKSGTDSHPDLTVKLSDWMIGMLDPVTFSKKYSTFKAAWKEVSDGLMMYYRQSTEYGSSYKRLVSEGKTLYSQQCRKDVDAKAGGEKEPTKADSTDYFVLKCNKNGASQLNLSGGIAVDSTLQGKITDTTKRTDTSGLSNNSLSKNSLSGVEKPSEQMAKPGTSIQETKIQETKPLVKDTGSSGQLDQSSTRKNEEKKDPLPETKQLDSKKDNTKPQRKPYVRNPLVKINSTLRLLSQFEPNQNLII
jgi:hypothetical protein